MIPFDLKDNLNNAPQETDWWSHLDIIKNNLKNQFIDEEEALNQLDKHLDQSVKEQSISDVPWDASYQEV